MWAVLPLKPIAKAKQRLSRLLTTEERYGLVKAMAEDVLTVLRESRHIDNILILSKGEYAAKLARKYDLPILNTDYDIGLNSAISAAARYLEHENVSSMLVVPGDIPQMNPGDLDRLIESHTNQTRLNPKAVTLVSDTSGNGTNGMCCSPPSIIPFCCGNSRSMRKHRRWAEDRSARFQLCLAASMETDIDKPEGLANLVVSPRRSAGASHTLHYLDKSGITDKLRAP